MRPFLVQVEDLFVVDRDRESESFKDVGNRQLLWHGSRMTNWVGILSQGLRIAPPEAPMTGYMVRESVCLSAILVKGGDVWVLPSTSVCVLLPSKMAF